jgi:type II secretory pathway pseudopilin PulG
MKRLRFNVGAFSLVEITLALGVAAFCLLAVFGLVPVGVQTNRNATSQTAATNVMSAVIADMRATPKTYDNSKTYSVGDSVLLSGNCYTAITTTTGHSPPNTTYWTTGSTCPQFGISIPTDPTSPPDPPPCSGSQTLYFNGEGQAATLPGADSRYRLVVTFVRNSAGSTAATYARVTVTWPAAVDPCTTMPSGSVETFAAFARN